LLNESSVAGRQQTITIFAANRQETQLSLTNRATRLEVSRGHQTWYHSICYVWFPIVSIL